MLAGLHGHFYLSLSDVLPSLSRPYPRMRSSVHTPHYNRLWAGAAIRENLVESMKTLLDAAESMGIPLVREGGAAERPGYLLHAATGV